MSPEAKEKEEKRLKFQSAIDSLRLEIPCPPSVFSIEDETEAFRFCHTPININIDFLPNVIYDTIVGIGFDYSVENKNEKQKCSRCGASFFTSISGIISKWSNLSPQNKENLGYTAIAKGSLTTQDGLMTTVDKKGHFGFYEYEGATFHTGFKIEKELT